MRSIFLLLLVVGCTTTAPASIPTGDTSSAPCPNDAACVEACRDGHASSCKLACDSGDIASCTMAGAVAMAEQDRGAATAMFKKACAGGDHTACDLVESLALTAKPPITCTPGDVEMCSLACRRGDGTSCRHLAVVYDEGGPVESDRKEAQRWYETACLLGDLESCERAKNTQRKKDE